MGNQVASYTYDAFNRRVGSAAVGQPEGETVWSGWRAIERYVGGDLAERRTFGSGLDEVVSLESDLDGDGSLEQK